MAEIDVDYLAKRIGELVLGAPLVAATLRHQLPVDSIRDYGHVSPNSRPEDQIAMAYLRDIVSRKTTSEMIEKWYEEGAVRLFRKRLPSFR